MAPADGRAANLVQVEVPLERARRRGRLGGAANLYLSHVICRGRGGGRGEGRGKDFALEGGIRSPSSRAFMSQVCVDVSARRR